MRGGAGHEDGPVSPRPAPLGRRSSCTAVERLEELYALLQTLACLGLYEHSCGEVVDASAAERQRLMAAGVKLDAPPPMGPALP